VDARIREEEVMIDREHPVVQQMMDNGYDVAAHVYLRSSGRTNCSVIAKERETRRVVQGWGRIDLEEALRDLQRRAGLPPHQASCP
jgi:hypothetical protein